LRETQRKEAYWQDYDIVAANGALPVSRLVGRDRASQKLSARATITGIRAAERISRAGKRT